MASDQQLPTGQRHGEEPPEQPGSGSTPVQRNSAEAARSDLQPHVSDGGGIQPSLGQEVVGISKSFEREFARFRSRLRDNHDKIGDQLVGVLAAIQRWLDSDNEKLVEKAIRLFAELQKTAYGQDLESWKFEDKVNQRILDHRERMTGNSPGSVPDFVANAK